jgi:malonate-semialdehyde dehydrogenase (acetylating)/methylmalonate-semialdehyde dehydrogenase
MNQITHWINGALDTSKPERSGDIYNPATGKVTKTVAFGNAATVDSAVTAATNAFSEWRHSSLTKRSQVLFAFRELVLQNREKIAALITDEHGKVLSDAAGEVTRGLEVVEFACGIPHLLKGGYSEEVSTGVDVYSIRQALGPVAIISPFNFPAMVPMWFFPVAIACGNTVIVKPSEKDPSAAMFMAQLWKDAGLPDGVFNVVHGDKEVVDALLVHKGIKSISFVGSTPIARYVYETGTKSGKRVQALGGAKNHMVVLPDADLELAADAAINAGFGSAGERCMAISAIVAVEPIASALVARIKSRMANIKTGDLKVAGDGFFLGPTLLDNVTPEMSVYTDEIFGPVLSILRVSTYDEALALVNSHEYGNGTAIFTNDGGAARRFQNEVEVGMVGINVPIPVPMAYYSFGGWKNSLFGDSHAHGTEGVHFFTRGKVITSRWLDPSHGGINLGFPQND